MRYSFITIIIGVVWVIILIVSGAFPEVARNLFYLALFSTLGIFFIGFQSNL